ncbi:MAG: thioredoxin family protein [Acidobacteria bacterium]|nr:thioredoxin family protein [Acidobacteriota bacterium]MBI3657292.1 thioredoxin family protein [Acidobacteriota bacterium]
MRKLSAAFAELMALVIGVALITGIQAADPMTVKIGERVSDFKLKDYTDKEHALYDWKGHKAVVIMFIATQCPVSNAYNVRMVDMAKEYRAKGVAFVAINSNQKESVAEVAAHARKNNFPFPVLKDQDNSIADYFKAGVTPETFLLDADWIMQYHGAIDNNKDLAKVTSQDLRKALDALLSGRKIEKTETKAFGCAIKRVKKP